MISNVNAGACTGRAQYDDWMLRTLDALRRSSHPGPTFLVTTVAVVLGVGANLDVWRIVVVGLVILLDQLSVGWSNDWIDSARDREVGRADKPVATGEISPTLVRNAALIGAALSVLVSIPLGWLAVLVHAVFLASAWSYNLWLKNTPVSVLPFIVSFGLLPLIVTVSATDPAAAAPWALGAGALLGVAAHFSNVLPDLEADLATGIQGLPHRLGATASGVVIAGALATASGLLLIGSPDPLHVAGFAAGLAVAVAILVLVLDRRRTRLLFQLIMAAAVIDVLLLAVGGSGLV